MFAGRDSTGIRLTLGSWSRIFQNWSPIVLKFKGKPEFLRTNLPWYRLLGLLGASILLFRYWEYHPKAGQSSAVVWIIQLLIRFFIKPPIWRVYALFCVWFGFHDQFWLVLASEYCLFFFIFHSRWRLDSCWLTQTPFAWVQNPWILGYWIVDSGLLVFSAKARASGEFSYQWHGLLSRILLVPSRRSPWILRSKGLIWPSIGPRVSYDVNFVIL